METRIGRAENSARKPGERSTASVTADENDYSVIPCEMICGAIRSLNGPQWTCINRNRPTPMAGPSSADTITMIMGLTNMTHPAHRHPTRCRLTATQPLVPP